MTRVHRETVSWLDTVDMAAVVRGCGRGFLVLVFGGLVAPALALSSPVLGSVLLAGSTVVAFVLAAVKQGSSANGPLHGVLAAFGAYFLVVPLVVLAPAGRDVGQIALTVAAAVVIGAGAGWAASRWRSRKTGGRKA